MMTLMMTERELEVGSVMDRLARMLAESTTPPSPKRRLIEELLSGNFESLNRDGDQA
jgi:hypothetical protein